MKICGFNKTTLLDYPGRVAVSYTHLKTADTPRKTRGTTEFPIARRSAA